jgi:hypothetical protein
MKEKIYAIWRIDGEFAVTEIHQDYVDQIMDNPTISDDSLIELCILSEHQDDHSEAELKELISIATDPNYLKFQGYEIITVLGTEYNLSWYR